MIVALTCAAAISGCSAGRHVSSTMFAPRALTNAIRTFQSYDGDRRVEDVYLTCKTVEVLFRQRGLWHDAVRTRDGRLTDDVTKDGPPDPSVSFPLRLINAAGPVRLIETLRQKLRDGEFLPADIDVGPTGIIARGVSHGRAVWFSSAADGGSARAIAVEHIPLEPTCAAG